MWLIEQFKRSRISLFLVLVVAVCIVFIPPEGRMGLLGLFTTKTMGVALGILFAHWTRLFRFPYLDLSALVESHHWSGVIFLTVWYGVIIWAFAVGG